MGIHVAGTQRGLVYALAPLKGERAPIITALLSRAPAAHVEFRPLQELIWQIDGGLSYNEMPPQSRQLIDQLVPEYKGELREDFLTALQNRSNKFGTFLGNIGFKGAANLETGAVNALVQEYQRIHQALIQNANNYDALAQNFVHVIPGTAPNPGPTAWSRVNSRVYARLIGGSVYGEMARLEVRVLPSANYGETTSAKSAIQEVSYPSGNGQYWGSNAGNDFADVPLESVLAYPNQSASQVLTPVTEVGGRASQRVLTLVALSVELNNVQGVLTNLMWLDCLPGSVGDAVAYMIQPAAPPSVSEAVGLAAQFDDVYNAVDSALESGGPAGLLAAGFEQVAFAELQQQGISCSNHNIVQAIMKAASQYRVNSTNSPFTSSTLVPDSLSLNAGVINGKVLTSAGTSVNFQLKFTPCYSASSCRAAIASAPNSWSLTSHKIHSGEIPISPTTMQPPASATQASLTLNVSSASVAEGAQFTVSGIVKNAIGGLQAGATVQVSASVSGSTLPLTTVTTATDGTFSAVLNAPPVAGSIVIAATVQGASPPVQGTATLTVTGNQ